MLPHALVHSVHGTETVSCSRIVRIIGDSQNILPRTSIFRLLLARSVHPRQLLDHRCEISLALGFRIIVGVVNAKLVRMRRRPAECDLQSSVEFGKGCRRWGGEGAPHRRVRDLIWTDAEFEEIVWPFAVFLVRGPLLGLAFFGAVTHTLAASTGLQRGIGLGAGGAGRRDGHRGGYGVTN